MKHKTKFARYRRQAIAIGFAAVVAASCSSSATKASPAAAVSTTKPTDSAAPASSHADVTIKTFQFSPSPATVKAGEITVVNEDNTTHTFTSDAAGAFNVSLTGPHATKTVTVKAGTYKFHCAIHTSMTGELIVQ